MRQSSNPVLVVKANGEREAFVPEKLYHSLVHSGAEKDVAERITRNIADSLRGGESTKEIYKRAFARLRHVQRPVAARYSLKRALFDLGPSGYPFEDFLGEIYRARGYQVSNRRLINGMCVEHELDMIAIKDGERIGAEAKYHNNSGLKSDVKVALYVHARFEDIKARAREGSDHDYTVRMLVTNTKFTEQARMYGACAGLTLIGWDYPEEGNLRILIEETGVHPVSCLTSLSRMQKRRLMEEGVVLCRQLKDHIDLLSALKMSEKDLETLFDEVDRLYQEE